MRAYAADDQDPLHVGRELDVEAVLEGHVLVRSNRVRVTARLLEISDGTALWSGSFEEPLDQFFAAQDALAGQVISALQIEMTDRDRFRAMATRVREKTGHKGKALFHPIRVVLTGEPEGLELDVAVPALEQGALLAGGESGLPPILGARGRAAALVAALRP